MAKISFLTAWAKRKWDKLKFWDKVYNSQPMTHQEFSDFRDFLVELVQSDEQILDMVKHPGFRRLEERVLPRYEDLIQKAMFEENTNKKIFYLNEAKVWNVLFSTIEEIPQEQDVAIQRYKEIKAELEPITERS